MIAMRVPLLAASLLLVACGRLGFDGVVPATDGPPGSDAPIPDAPPGVCAGVFCDGFEGGLGGWEGLVQLGTTVVESAAGAGLTGDALTVAGGVGDNLGWVFQRAYKGQTAVDRWVRVYLFLPSTLNLDMEPIALANADDTARVVLSLAGSSVNLHSHGMATDFASPDASPPPRDRWVCFELHVEVGTAGRVELFVDGALVVSQAPVDTSPPGSDLDLLAVGIVSKSMPVSQTLLADEVVAGVARPGCN